jgi:hypothetical protein
MKLTSSRNGWSVTGQYITLIPAGVTPTDDEMLAYWHLKPGNARFAEHARPSRFVRCVLLKHNGNFIIVPLSADISEVTA